MTIRRPFCRARAVLVLGFLVAIGVGQAQGPPSGNPAARVHVESVGPQVGAVLPDFNLRDQRGQMHSLKSSLGPKGAMIVFFRSADW
jgi:hypothetical protein